MSVPLQIAERVAYSHLSRPYIWGGDNPLEGFDCSGFVIEILKSVGILPRAGDWTARGLYAHFQDVVTVTPQLGCLVFWGSPIIHVEFCISSALSIGASGGRRTTVDEVAAIQQDAYIKIRPFATRAGVVGFVDPFRRLTA
jgi:cell wall-associated NlpC family hydrolase